MTRSCKLIVKVCERQEFPFCSSIRSLGLRCSTTPERVGEAIDETGRMATRHITNSHRKALSFLTFCYAQEATKPKCVL